MLDFTEAKQLSTEEKRIKHNVWIVIKSGKSWLTKDNLKPIAFFRYTLHSVVHSNCVCSIKIIWYIKPCIVQAIVVDDYVIVGACHIQIY